MKYNKLIRDKIPEIIRTNGDKPVIHQADRNEYHTKLKEKLREETQEFIEGESEEELADILEVIYALCEFKGKDKNQIEQIRQRKAEERGTFKQRIILEKTR